MRARPPVAVQHRASGHLPAHLFDRASVQQSLCLQFLPLATVVLVPMGSVPLQTAVATMAMGVGMGVELTRPFLLRARLVGTQPTLSDVIGREASFVVLVK